MTKSSHQVMLLPHRILLQSLTFCTFLFHSIHIPGLLSILSQNMFCVMDTAVGEPSPCPPGAHVPVLVRAQFTLTSPCGLHCFWGYFLLSGLSVYRVGADEGQRHPSCRRGMSALGSGWGGFPAMVAFALIPHHKKLNQQLFSVEFCSSSRFMKGLLKFSL